MGQVPSACRHRHQNRQMLDTQRQDRAGKRHRLQELREQEFPSDDDDNGIWRAWGGEGELSLADGRPFSSGTEGDNSGKEFEATLREVLGLAENHLRLTRDDGGLDAEVASRLQKAHRRVARDLAAVECAHIIGWNAHFKKAQLDGVGNLSKDMLQMGEWLVEPEEISGLCVAEFCINSKAFSAKLYQLGRVAEMIQAGAKWLEARPCSDDINSTDRITYLIVVDKSRPQLSPERILRRYTALNQAYEDGRFGVLYVSVTTLARALKRGRLFGMVSLSFSCLHHPSAEFPRLAGFV